MENPKCRRGISLSHQHNASQASQFFLDKSVYVDPQQTTRLQYPRYHLLASPSRHASAPKGKVQFAYPIPVIGNTVVRGPQRHVQVAQESFYVPPPPNRSSALLVPSLYYPRPAQIQPEPPKVVESAPLVLQPLPVQNEAITQTEKEEPNQQISFINEQTEGIPQKYHSFEQCKEVISKRLFGTGSIVKKESVLQQSDRGNRWAQEIKQESKQKGALSQTSILDSIKEFAKLSYIEEVPKKKQLNIQHEVVNYAAQAKVSKQNAPPYIQNYTLNPALHNSMAPQTSIRKQGRKARDPLKLQDMEKRLMEIIKICDENLS